MEDVDSNKPKIKQERGNDIFHRITQMRDGMPDGRGGEIEYFLTKLKRLDDEMLTSSAEIREIKEEISRKDFKIGRLKLKLENLMRAETKREIKKLEQMKSELQENIKKADRVLAGLGLIWVGEHTDGTSPDLGVRFIATPEGSFYRPDPGYHEITKEQTSVTPFSGRGYRLGTSSEIFGPQPSEPDAERTSGRTVVSASSSSRHTKEDTGCAGSRNWPRYGLDRTSSDNRIRQADALGGTKVKSLEELPLEFRLMSKSERRRAFKQVSVQIQKNMNKYTE